MQMTLTPLETLAKRYPQLYVAPAEGASEANRRASGRGMTPPDANLEHFIGSPADELREVETPAGPIEVLFLEQRRDFETFLQIVSHRSEPVAISRTVGAMTYLGLADWGKVAAARESFLREGGTHDAWPEEFRRLAGEPGAFRNSLVVISEGPYSGLPADRTPYAGNDAEWARVSREIRLYHECAHVVCRRTMPNDVLPIWDEVTADVCGLIGATGSYDAVLAMRFLGVGPDGYEDGRLPEYLNDDQQSRIDEISAKLWAAALRIESLSRDTDPMRPFDFMLQLKRDPLVQE